MISRRNIGLGLDFSLGMTFDDQQTLAREAAELGYTSLWTPEGAGLDSFQLCALRWRASADVVEGGIGTGIGVCPIAYRSPIAFAMSAGTLSAQSGGKFTLGIGSGGIYREATRRQLGLPRRSTLTTMREYVAAVRGLLAGESVTIAGQAIQYDGATLGFRPPPTPVLVGALGPEMIRLGAEVGDGAVLNWCDPERVGWSRERLNEGAAAGGKSPDDVQLVEYIRICVDDDVAVARHSYAQSLMGYALGDSVPSDRLAALRLPRALRADGLHRAARRAGRHAPARRVGAGGRSGDAGGAADAGRLLRLCGRGARGVRDARRRARHRDRAGRRSEAGPRLGPGGDAGLRAQRLIGADHFERVGEDLHGVVDLRLGGGGGRHEAQH